MFTLGGGALSWISVKQSCIINFTMEVKYVIVFEVVKEVFGLEIPNGT